MPLPDYANNRARTIGALETENADLADALKAAIEEITKLEHENDRMLRISISLARGSHKRRSLSDVA